MGNGEAPRVPEVWKWIATTVVGMLIGSIMMTFTVIDKIDARMEAKATAVEKNLTIRLIEEKDAREKADALLRQADVTLKQDFIREVTAIKVEIRELAQREGG